MKEIVRSCSALMSPHAYVKPLKWSLYPPSTLQSIPLYYTNWLQINIMQKETLCPSKDKYIFQPLIWVFLNKIEQCICNSKEHLCSIKLFKPAKFILDENGVEYMYLTGIMQFGWVELDRHLFDNPPKLMAIKILLLANWLSCNIVGVVAVYYVVVW